MTNTFDLCDLSDSPPPDVEPMSELNEWAEKAIEPRDNADQFCVFDIETGPRPIEEIEDFYNAPAPLPPWNDSMTKYGNAKRDELRKQKRDEQFAEYQTKLADQETANKAHLAAWLEKAAISPVTGRVLLIGMLHGKNPLFIDGPDEAKNLEEFWQVVEDFIAKKIPIIGHNSNGFDLPFLVRRSWCLGVPVPREVRQGRYWNPLFRDTMEQWNCGTREFIKLDVLGQFFGVGQKTEGVAGGDFHKLWFGTMDAEQWGSAVEQRVKALEYNGQDLKLTAAVAAKMGMV